MAQARKRGIQTERETLTVSEAAKVLGIGRLTIYQAIREGKMPALRIGRKPRIVVPREALRRMLEEVAK